jgi:hypothetical protein
VAVPVVVICGALSDPVAHYEERLIWLVPALVLSAGCTRAAQALAQIRCSLNRTNATRSAAE